MVKIEKLILKTNAIDNLLLAPMERAPQSYPGKTVNSKPPKIELNSFTKPGPSYNWGQGGWAGGTSHICKIYRDVSPKWVDFTQKNL